MEKLAGIEMVRLRDGYRLRKHPSLREPVKKKDIYYNGKLIWMGDWILVKQEAEGTVGYRPRRIVGYGYDFFYVESEQKTDARLTKINMEVEVAGRCWMLPEGGLRHPVWRDVPLTNASTRKAGHPFTSPK